MGINRVYQPDILEAPHRRHHHHPRRHFRPITEVYIPQTPAQLYYGSSQEEVDALVRAGECLVLRRQGGPDYLRPDVVNGLKARGWVEQVDVQPANGFNVKIVKLCPLPASSSISGLGRIRLGQGPPRLRVTVVDRRGEPAPGIGISVLSPDNIGEGVTDDDGAVVVDVPNGKTEAIVIASLPEGEVRQRVVLTSLGMQTVAFRSIRKISGPLVTPVEGIAVLVGISLIVIGVSVGGVPGDIAAGIGGSVTAASVYSGVSRHV